MPEEVPGPQGPDERERFRGCLLGLVVGECLGASLEGLSSAVIQRLHDRVTEIRGGGFLRVRAGQHGQASEIMLRTAESLVELRRFDMESVVEAWLHWRQEEDTRLDETTQAAFGRLEKGTSWRDSGRKVAETHGAGNGSLSRVAPVALYFLRDATSLLQHTREITAVTHAHHEAVGAGAALAALLSGLAGGMSCSSAVESAAEVARGLDESLVAGCIRGSAQKEIRDLRASSYSLHTLEAAVWCVETTSSFEEALIAVVNLGGSAATNGAVTGAVAGSLHGATAIPDRWKAGVEARDRALHLADELFLLTHPSSG